LKLNYPKKKKKIKFFKKYNKFKYLILKKIEENLNKKKKKSVDDKKEILNNT